jgi:lysophospholipid acyltransferase (LPLAT)-like uncharacterized protein
MMALISSFTWSRTSHLSTPFSRAAYAVGGPILVLMETAEK